jgi:hypothetical protein
MLSEETGAIVRATIPVVGASLDTIAARFYRLAGQCSPVHGGEGKARAGVPSRARACLCLSERAGPGPGCRF